MTRVGRNRPDLVVTCDPARAFGKPCINGTRTPISAIAGCVWAGDSVAFTAENYEVTEEEVRLACWYAAHDTYAKHSKSDRRRAVAWREWADDWLRWAGRHSDQHPGNPPEKS